MSMVAFLKTSKSNRVIVLSDMGDAQIEATEFVV